VPGARRESVVPQGGVGALPEHIDGAVWLARSGRRATQRASAHACRPMPGGRGYLGKKTSKTLASVNPARCSRSTWAWACCTVGNWPLETATKR
jgi:hypothetical protein